MLKRVKIKPDGQTKYFLKPDGQTKYFICQKCHLVTFYGKRRKYLLHRKNHCIQFIDQLSGQEIIWTHPCKEPQIRRGVLIKHPTHFTYYFRNSANMACYHISLYLCYHCYSLSTDCRNSMNHVKLHVRSCHWISQCNHPLRFPQLQQTACSFPRKW